jgi:hypothetical protein
LGVANRGFPTINQYPDDIETDMIACEAFVLGARQAIPLLGQKTFPSLR